MPTLYQKHRPILFSEISGQAHIVKTLSNSIVNNRIGQAYLFTGSRGIGKTTLARIFSKAVNCLKPIKKNKGILLEPCNKCQNCRAIMENKTIDINEIDGASHTGVDNIRQLKEKVNLTPSLLKYKIYIIDEVHMLSIGAFNALLKTLEEPPKHVIFILATTELHKIPETIVSRCQRFNFNRLTQDQIIDRLKQIAKKEKVKIDNLALEIIAVEAEGGMRDAESILNQIIALEDKNITGEEVSQILGTSSQNQIVKFIEQLFDNDIKAILNQINELQNQGIYLKNFNKTFLSILRNLVINKINPEIKNTAIFSKENSKKLEKITQNNEIEKFILAIKLFQKSLNEAKNSTIPQLPLELASIEFYLKQNPSQEPSVENTSSYSNTSSPQKPVVEKNQTPKVETFSKKNTSELKSSLGSTQENPGVQPKEEKKQEQAVDTVKNENSQVNLDFKKIIDNWSKILETVKIQNHSIYACLQSCVPVNLKDKTFYIQTHYSFHKNRLNDNKNKLTIIEIIDKITRYKVRIEFITEDQIEDLNLTNNLSENDDDVFNNAIKIMGGRVVD